MPAEAGPAGLIVLSRLGAYFARVGALQPNARRYLVGAFLMGIGHGAVWVHMNLYYRALGLSESQIGRILSAGSLGTVILAVPAALWADRIPAQRVFGLAAAGFGAVLALQLLAKSPWLLAGAAFLAGGFFTVHWVAAAPFIMRNARPEDRLYFFGFTHAFETVATIVAALGVGALAHGLERLTGSELQGLRLALLAVAGLTFLALISFSRIQSAPPLTERKSWREYLMARDWSLLAKLILPASLVGLGAGLIIPFLNLYFRDRFGQDPREIGLFFAVSQFLTVLGFLAGPPLARRAGSVASIVATELASIPFFLMLAFARNLPLALIAFWMRGALMNMNQPISTNFAMEKVASDQQTVTNSIRMLAWNGAWMVSAPVGGWMIERQGFALPMFVTVGLYFSASVLFYVFFRRDRETGRS